MIILEADRLLRFRPGMDDAACGFDRRNASLCIGFIGDQSVMPIPVAIRETRLCKLVASKFPKSEGAS